jgi:hypothetical protein
MAVLEQGLPAADREAAVRRTHAERWRQTVESSDRVMPFGVVEGAAPGYLRYPASVAGGLSGRDLRQLRLHGVMPGYPATLADLPSLAGGRVDPGTRLPGATFLSRSVVTFPTHSRLAQADVQAIQSYAQRLDAA